MTTAHSAEARPYNFSLEFAGLEEIEAYAARHGFVKVEEKARRNGNGYKVYYLCGAFGRMTAGCAHRFTAIVANGRFLGKATDGGTRHHHEVEEDRCKDQKNSEREKEVDRQREMRDLMRPCTPSLLSKMKAIHEKMKNREEQRILDLFEKLPIEKQQEVIHIHEQGQHMETPRGPRQLVGFARERLGEDFDEALLQQSQLSALGFEDDDNDDLFASSSQPKDETKGNDADDEDDSPVFGSLPAWGSAEREKVPRSSTPLPSANEIGEGPPAKSSAEVFASRNDSDVRGEEFERPSLEEPTNSENAPPVPPPTDNGASKEEDKELGARSEQEVPCLHLIIDEEPPDGEDPDCACTTPTALPIARQRLAAPYSETRFHRQARRAAAHPYERRSLAVDKESNLRIYDRLRRIHQAKCDGSPREPFDPYCYNYTYKRFNLASRLNF